MIRSYCNGDEVGIVDLWNEACPRDPISMDLFTKKVLADANFDPKGLIVYEEDEKIAGFLLALVRHLPLLGNDLEPENGWITATMVDPSKQRQGIGEQMLEAAKTFFRNQGTRQIFFSSYAPNYFVPGIDASLYPQGKAWLEKNDFQVLYSPVAMDRNLVSYAYPDDVRKVEADRKQEGYVFEFLSPKYVAEVIRFNHKEMANPDWARAVREAIAQGISFDNVLIARKEGRVVGFCMYGAYDGVGERFGPFGVDESLRGTGLGKVLLYKCLHVMKAKGLHTAWFLWTGEKSPAGYLYYRAGFEVTRKFDVMKMNLS